MLITFILFITVFSIIIEVFCVLFRLTGLPEDKARFQVVSILTGTGFTTRESELIAQHPTRRSLAQFVMVLGYVGLATFISFFVNMLKNNLSLRDTLILIAFCSTVIFVLKNKYLLAMVDRLISKILLKGRLRNKHIQNIYTLLNQKNGYGLYHVLIEEGSPIIGEKLKESDLKDKRIQVLTIDKGNKSIEFPSADYIFEKGDNVLVYGKTANVRKSFNIR